MHAPTGSSEKKKFWKGMTDNPPPAGTPWIVMGDMNEVTHHSEKVGGRKVAHNQGAAFVEMMDNTGLIDLSFHGPEFTWNNCRDGIRERLDRALANANFLDSYPNTQGKGKGKKVVDTSLKHIWQPPKNGAIKLNTDGSWKDSSTAGGGGVLRREDGTWVIGYSMRMKARKPVETELLAIRQGLEIARDMGVESLILETDAKTLKIMLQNIEEHIYSELGAILVEVGQLLSRYGTVDIVHVHRHANNLAHTLAHQGRTMEGSYRAYEEVPAFAKPAYDEDKQLMASTAGA